MALPMIPIYTQTTDSSNPFSLTFNNIPQIYTDLMVVVSARSVSGPAGGRMRMGINTDSGANFSSTLLSANGSSAFSLREPNSTNLIVGPYSLSTDTANTFTNINIYIPNYTSNAWKQISSESVKENNSATITNYDGISVIAGLWKGTSPITALTFGPEGGLFAANSTISLYGILRYGA